MRLKESGGWAAINLISTVSRILLLLSVWAGPPNSQWSSSWGVVDGRSVSGQFSSSFPLTTHLGVHHNLFGGKSWTEKVSENNHNPFYAHSPTPPPPPLENRDGRYKRQSSQQSPPQSSSHQIPSVSTGGSSVNNLNVRLAPIISPYKEQKKFGLVIRTFVSYRELPDVKTSNDYINTKSFEAKHVDTSSVAGGPSMGAGAEDSKNLANHALEGLSGRLSSLSQMPGEKKTGLSSRTKNSIIMVTNQEAQVKYDNQLNQIRDQVKVDGDLILRVETIVSEYTPLEGTKGTPRTEIETEIHVVSRDRLDQTKDFDLGHHDLLQINRARDGTAGYRVSKSAEPLEVPINLYSKLEKTEQNKNYDAIGETLIKQFEDIALSKPLKMHFRREFDDVEVYGTPALQGPATEDGQVPVMPRIPKDLQGPETREGHAPVMHKLFDDLEGLDATERFSLPAVSKPCGRRRRRRRKRGCACCRARRLELNLDPKKVARVEEKGSQMSQLETQFNEDSFTDFSLHGTSSEGGDAAMETALEVRSPSTGLTNYDRLIRDLKSGQLMNRLGRGVRAGVHTIKTHLSNFNKKFTKLNSRLGLVSKLFVIRDLAKAIRAGDEQAIVHMSMMTGISFVGSKLYSIGEKALTAGATSNTLMALGQGVSTGVAVVGMGFSAISIFNNVKCLEQKNKNDAGCVKARKYAEGVKAQAKKIMEESEKENEQQQEVSTALAVIENGKGVAARVCMDDNEICGGRNAILEIVQSSLAIVGSVISMAFPPAALVIGLIQLLFGFFMEAYQAQTVVDNFHKYIPLTESEKLSEFATVLLTGAVSEEMDNLRQKQKINTAVLNQMGKSLDGKTFWAFLAPAYNAIKKTRIVYSKKKNCWKDLDRSGASYGFWAWVTGGIATAIAETANAIKKATVEHCERTEPYHVPEVIENNQVDLSDYGPRYFQRWSPNPDQDTSEFNDENFFCRPMAHSLAVQNQKYLSGTGHKCVDALGYQRTRARDPLMAMVDLGDGKDEAVGHPKYPNCFIVGRGHKNFAGGAANDYFFFNGSNNAYGYLDGQKGNDTFEPSAIFQDTTKGARMTISSLWYPKSAPSSSGQQELTLTGLNVKVELRNVEILIGRSNLGDTITPTCHNMLIDGKGGGGADDLDTIRLDHQCPRYEVEVKVRDWTQVVNRRGQGTFFYDVDTSNGTRRTSRSIDIQHNDDSSMSTFHVVTVHESPRAVENLSFIRNSNDPPGMGSLFIQSSRLNIKIRYHLTKSSVLILMKSAPKSQKNQPSHHQDDDTQEAEVHVIPAVDDDRRGNRVTKFLPFFKFNLTRQTSGGNANHKNFIRGHPRYANHFFMTGTTYQVVMGGDGDDRFLFGGNAHHVTLIKTGHRGDKTIEILDSVTNSPMVIIDLVSQKVQFETVEGETVISQIEGFIGNVVGRQNGQDILIADCGLRTVNLQGQNEEVRVGEGKFDLIFINNETSQNDPHCSPATIITLAGRKSVESDFDLGHVYNGAREGSFTYAINEVEGSYTIFYVDENEEDGWSGEKNSNFGKESPPKFSQRFDLNLTFFQIQNIQTETENGCNFKGQKVHLRLTNGKSIRLVLRPLQNFDHLLQLWESHKNFEGNFTNDEMNRTMDSIGIGGSDFENVTSDLPLFPVLMTSDDYEIHVNHLGVVHVFHTTEMSLSVMPTFDLIDRHIHIVNHLGLSLIITRKSRPTHENGGHHQAVEMIFIGGDDETDHFINHPLLDTHLVGSAYGHENIFDLSPTILWPSSLPTSAKEAPKIFIYLTTTEEETVALDHHEDDEPTRREKFEIIKNFTTSTTKVVTLKSAADVQRRKQLNVIKLANFFAPIAMNSDKHEKPINEKRSTTTNLDIIVPTIHEEAEDLIFTIKYPTQVPRGNSGSKKLIEERQLIFINGVHDYEKVFVILDSALHRIGHKKNSSSSDGHDEEDGEPRWFLYLEDYFVEVDKDEEDHGKKYLDTVYLLTEMDLREHRRMNQSLLIPIIGVMSSPNSAQGDDDRLYSVDNDSLLITNSMESGALWEVQGFLGWGQKSQAQQLLSVLLVDIRRSMMTQNISLTIENSGAGNGDGTLVISPSSWHLLEDAMVAQNRFYWKRTLIQGTVYLLEFLFCFLTLFVIFIFLTKLRNRGPTKLWIKCHSGWSWWCSVIGCYEKSQSDKMVVEVDYTGDQNSEQYSALLQSVPEPTVLLMAEENHCLDRMKEEGDGSGPAPENFWGQVVLSGYGCKRRPDFPERVIGTLSYPLSNAKF